MKKLSQFALIFLFAAALTVSLFPGTAWAPYAGAGGTSISVPVVVGQGGTGVTTMTGIPVGTGAAPFAAYAGTSCTNQFPRALSASGVATCASVVAADISTSPAVLCVAASDETTALTAGTAKVTFRMPYAMTLTAVRASLTTAQGAGAIFTVDINEAGATILSTKLTIDNNELTSTTAATPPVISDSALADDASMTVDIDQIGNSTATGLKVCLIGTRS